MSQIRLLVKSALFVGVLIYVGIELGERLGTDALATVQLDWSYAIGGSLCAWLSLALFALLYREAQLLFEPAAGWLPATLVAWISPLGKYVPGKVGSLLGAVWIYRKFGIGAPVAASVLLVATGSALSACFFVLLPFSVAGDAPALGSASMLIWPVLAAGLLCTYPPLFLIPLNQVLHFVGQQKLTIDTPFIRYLRLVVLGVGQLVLAGSSFWLMANAVTEVGLGDWYLLTAAYTVAGVVGMLALFAPGGLGVREGLLLLLLESAMDGAELALAVVLTRIGLIIAEVLLALTGMIVWRVASRTNSSS